MAPSSSSRPRPDTKTRKAKGRPAAILLSWQERRSSANIYKKVLKYPSSNTTTLKPIYIQLQNKIKNKKQSKKIVSIYKNPANKQTH